MTTPGEEKIYNFILEVSAQCARRSLMADCTNKILNCYAGKEIDRLKEIEDDIWKDIFERLGSAPIWKKFNYHGLFCSVINDILCAVQYSGSSQGHWVEDPLNEKFCAFTYKQFDEKLGISRDVAKSCIDRLVARGKIQRKRGFGGIKYAPCLKDLTVLLKESPGNFKPTTFSPHTMAFEEDDSLLDIFEHAQHGLESFQEYYERMLVDRLREVK